MNTPIKTQPRPPVSKPPQSHPRAQPERGAQTDNRPGPPGPRRGDSERNRPAWAQSTPESPLNADGLFFSQLLVQPVAEEPDHSGFSGSVFCMSSPSDDVPIELIDELAQHLPGQPEGPFSVTLLMPNMGKVKVNASKRDNQWSVELRFARNDVLKRLQPRQHTCEQALANALGNEVELSFHEDLAI